MMTYPYSPDPYKYYAICNKQVIAEYRHDLQRFIRDVKAIYADQIENFGVIIIDDTRTVVATLGIVWHDNRYSISDVFNFMETITASGNISVGVSESYSELIFFDHPENAIFAINTSTNLHVHTQGKAYLKVGNFIPPLPTITNWQNVFWRNFFTVHDNNFDTLIFKMRTDKTILLPKTPVKYAILEDQIRHTQSFSNYYAGIDATLILKVGDLKKLDIDFSELEEDTNWWFSDFQLIHNTNSYMLADNVLLNCNFSDNMVITHNGVAYEFSWIIFGLKYFQVTITTNGTVTSTTTIQGVDYIRYVAPVITGSTIIDVVQL